MSERLKYDYLVMEGNIGTGKTSLATRIGVDRGGHRRLSLESATAT